MADPAHRTGVVALLGPPNAGKSTLLNRLLGEKLAIATPRPQTTRSRILGILSRPRAQLLLLDTPGVHVGSGPLARAMHEQVERAAEDCDVGLLLVDLERGWRACHDDLLARLRARGAAAIAVGTKLDRRGARAAPWPPPGARGVDAALRVSARTGQGVEALLDAVEPHLPESPPLYPEDELSDRPLRFLAAELVREAAFAELSQELPYSLAVEVVEFDESRPELVRIRAQVLTLRDSQKRIVVGRGGEVIKRIGVSARREIEALLATRVYLELRVKVDPDWRRRPNRLKALGYS